MKTGSENQPWVVLDSPKPPRVALSESYWMSPPPQRSARCAYWVHQIERGWLPNRSICRNGYHSSADWYGVYIWEYLNVLAPLITQKRTQLASSGYNA